jgi:serine/threonine protein kinase
MTVQPTTLCPGCFVRPKSAAVCECGWSQAEPRSGLFLTPGTILGGSYIVGRVLGRGGFGITYLGFDTNLEVRVAIKEFLPNVFAERTSGGGEVRPLDGLAGNFDYGLDRFLGEAQTLAKFQEHPNIVTVVNFFRANGTGYLVMTYIEGITLMRRLEQADGRISVDETLGVLRGVLEALRDVHRVGLLHRDISPDNIFITSHGQVKLMDFGAARYAVGERTQNLTILLKSGFAPEEQYRTNGRQGAWTDMYAVGATVYRALTGVTPPPSIDRLREDDLIPLSRFNLTLPPSLEAALGRALAVLAENRVRSADELLALLPRPADGLSPTLPVLERIVPVEIRGKPRKRWIVASGLFLLTSAGLAAGWGYREYDLGRDVRVSRDRADDLSSRQQRMLRNLERQIAVSNLDVYNADENDKRLGTAIDDLLGQFERSQVRYFSWRLKLINNWKGVKSLSGDFKVKIYGPGGTLLKSANGPTDATSKKTINIDDSETISGGFGSKSTWLTTTGAYKIASRQITVKETELFKSPFSVPGGVPQ